MRSAAPRPRPRPFVGLVAASLVLASCVANHRVTDPVLRVRTEGGSELGVSTQHGIVFLGRTAERGAVEIESIFGDGPNVERSVIEPVGGGLYTADVEIRLPAVPISFAAPEPGESLVLVGRTPNGSWEREVTVAEDPRVFGLLVTVPGDFPDERHQVGAGVYRETGDHARELVGLVSGRVRLAEAGRPRVYLACYGPEHLWRVAAHRRELLRERPWVYREDVR